MGPLLREALAELLGGAPPTSVVLQAASCRAVVSAAVGRALQPTTPSSVPSPFLTVFSPSEGTNTLPSSSTDNDLFWMLPGLQGVVFSSLQRPADSETMALTIGLLDLSKYSPQNSYSSLQQQKIASDGIPEPISSGDGAAITQALSLQIQSAKGCQSTGGVDPSVTALAGRLKVLSSTFDGIQKGMGLFPHLPLFDCSAASVGGVLQPQGEAAGAIAASSLVSPIANNPGAQSGVALASLCLCASLVAAGILLRRRRQADAVRSRLTGKTRQQQVEQMQGGSSSATSIALHSLPAARSGRDAEESGAVLSGVNPLFKGKGDNDGGESDGGSNSDARGEDPTFHAASADSGASPQWWASSALSWATAKGAATSLLGQARRSNAPLSSVERPPPSRTERPVLVLDSIAATPAPPLPGDAFPASTLNEVTLERHHNHEQQQLKQLQPLRSRAYDPSGDPLSSMAHASPDGLGAPPFFPTREAIGSPEVTIVTRIVGAATDRASSAEASSTVQQAAALAVSPGSTATSALPFVQGALLSLSSPLRRARENLNAPLPSEALLSPGPLHASPPFAPSLAENPLIALSEHPSSPAGPNQSFQDGSTASLVDIRIQGPTGSSAPPPSSVEGFTISKHAPSFLQPPAFPFAALHPASSAAPLAPLAAVQGSASFIVQNPLPLRSASLRIVGPGTGTSPHPRSLTAAPWRGDEPTLGSKGGNFEQQGGGDARPTSHQQGSGVEVMEQLRVLAAALQHAEEGQLQALDAVLPGGSDPSAFAASSRNPLRSFSFTDSAAAFKGGAAGEITNSFALDNPLRKLSKGGSARGLNLSFLGPATNK